MDTKLNHLHTLINTRKEKYPNLANFWLKYMDEKTKMYEESLDKAINVFEKMNTLINEDIPTNDIMLYCLIKNFINK